MAHCSIVVSSQHISSSPAFTGQSENIACAVCFVTIGISNTVCMLPPPVAPPRGIFMRPRSRRYNSPHTSRTGICIGGGGDDGGELSPESWVARYCSSALTEGTLITPRFLPSQAKISESGPVYTSGSTFALDLHTAYLPPPNPNMPLAVLR